VARALSAVVNLKIARAMNLPSGPGWTELLQGLCGLTRMDPELSGRTRSIRCTIPWGPDLLLIYPRLGSHLVHNLLGGLMELPDSSFQVHVTLIRGCS
jgi:hypothetical protein